ncbi:MAG: hypothetical protein ACT4PL_03005 [Phycisphaerales bacterium]
MTHDPGQHSTYRRRSRRASPARMLAILAGSVFVVGSAWAAQPPGDAPKVAPVPPTEKLEEAPAAAPVPAMAAPVPETCEFAISKFEFEFATDRHPSMPPMEVLLAESRVMLTRVNEGFVSARESVATGEVSVAELNAMLPEQGNPKFSRAAIRAVLSAVVRRLNTMGIIGIIVETDADDLVVERRPDAPGGEEWTDLREDRLELRLKLLAGTVGQVRTVAAGARVTGDAPRIDNEVHQRIRAGSPIKPYALGDEERADLLIKPLLDDYVLRLNRKQGRRVDIAVSGGESNTVILDYLVRENDPLLIYAQVSNTGTRETDRWRQRIGLIHNQLTGNDDQLALDYVTAAFEKTHIGTGTYTLPLDDIGDMRIKAFGGYAEFDASEVGRADENFTGNSFYAGLEYAQTVYQGDDHSTRRGFFGPSLFVDAFASLKFQHVEVNNQTVLVEGSSDFLIGALGARLTRETEESGTHGEVSIEFNLPTVAGTDSEELQRLGRLGTDKNWLMAKFNLDHSFFLEPIFDSENFDAGQSTLAHELFFDLRGQATSERVVPTYQSVAGGFYTVRGYDESVAAGDTVIIFTTEYRLHIPRLLDVEDVPGEFLGKPFRFAPQQAYGRPDWDLILRGFLDVAKTFNSERLSFEDDQSLVGAGAGIELLFNREVNLDMRLDLGVALDAVEGKAEAGDIRLHFSATIAF